MGVAAAFSFYPGKNLGACGEGGAVTTNDSEIARKIKVLRDHGQSKKYYHNVEGYNGRLDAMQAGFLGIKLRHLRDWNAQRQECAARYQELLGSAGEGMILPYEPSWSKAVYHLFVIRVRDRVQLQKHLAEAHIGTAIHYPVPLHLQNAYAILQVRRGQFPGCREGGEGNCLSTDVSKPGRAPAGARRQTRSRFRRGSCSRCKRFGSLGLAACV